MLKLKINVHVEANKVDLDQAASVPAVRSRSPMFNQMVQVLDGVMSSKPLQSS